MPPEAVPSNMKVSNKKGECHRRKSTRNAVYFSACIAGMSLRYGLWLASAPTDKRRQKTSQACRSQPQDQPRNAVRNCFARRTSENRSWKFPQEKKGGGKKSGQEAAIQPRGSVHKLSRELSSEHSSYGELWQKKKSDYTSKNDI